MENASGIDWSNIDLNSNYQRSLEIIDGYDFETLLLEINCNIRDINPVTVMIQFEEILQMRIRSARETMEDNLNNIVKYANDYRKEP